MATVTQVTDENFETIVIEGQRPSLVDFWAPGCAPCQMISPLLEKLAKDFEGEVDIYKINVNENPNIAGGMGVRSIPYLVTFKNGDIMETIIGAPEPQKLVDMLENLLDD